jgi:hypothetical protein
MIVQKRLRPVVLWPVDAGVEHPLRTRAGGPAARQRVLHQPPIAGSRSLLCADGCGGHHEDGGHNQEADVPFYDQVHCRSRSPGSGLPLTALGTGYTSYVGTMPETQKCYVGCLASTEETQSVFCKVPKATG